MVGKINRNHVMQGMNNAKNFLGQAYHHSKNFLGKVDIGVRAFNHVYGALAPIMDAYGAGGTNKHVMKALQGYDNIRGHVMEQHDKAMDHVNKIKNTLGHKNVRFEIS